MVTVLKKLYFLPTPFIYVFYTDLIANSDYFHYTELTIGFYN